MAKIDISLVNMPNFPVIYPSLSLSLLKSILREGGIKNKIIYGNLLFRDICGDDLARSTNKRRKNFLIEWLFSQYLWPEQEDNIGCYTEFLQKIDPPASQTSSSKIRECLADFRDRIRKFVPSLAERILSDEPDIVACTCLATQYFPSLAILKAVHNLAPRVITLMGGPSFEVPVAVATHKSFSFIDYIVLGEGDDLIKPLVTSMLEKGRYITEEELPEGVIGPVHRNNEYNNMEKIKVILKNSLNDLPVPDYDDYFDTISSLKATKDLYIPVLHFESSRGCWWGEKIKCTFCGENNLRQKYRKKSAEKILAELKTVSEKYKVTYFAASDSIMDREYFKTLFPELIKQKSPYKFFYQCRTTLTKEEIKILSDAGVERLEPGIESLHSKILKLMNKGIETWQNIQFLKWCLYYGVNTVWPFLYGLPGEKDEWYEEMAELMPLLYHLSPPLHGNSIHFCRNSIYFERAEEYGLKIIPEEIYIHFLPLPEYIIKDMAYYFIDEYERERKEDDMDSFYHQGRESVKKEIVKWHELFWTYKRPVLEMTFFQNSLEIKDTRPCAVKNSFILKNLAKEIYIACDTAPLKESLLKNFEEKSFTREEILNIIKELINWKLMVFIDNRLISLSVEKPLRIMPQKGMSFKKS